MVAVVATLMAAPFDIVVAPIPMAWCTPSCCPCGHASSVSALLLVAAAVLASWPYGGRGRMAVGLLFLSVVVRASAGVAEWRRNVRRVSSAETDNFFKTLEVTTQRPVK